MPTIDVSEVLSDPDFCEELIILRRTSVENIHGRAVITPTEISPRPLGIVITKDTAIGGNVIERTPEAQYRGAALDVYTTFRLRGPAPGYQPDVVMWNGDPYVVTLINDFSNFGRGYIHADCTSLTSIDQAPQ